MTKRFNKKRLEAAGLSPPKNTGDDSSIKSSETSSTEKEKDKSLQDFYNNADSIGKAYCEFRQVEQQMKLLSDAKQVTWPPYKQRFLDYIGSGGAKTLYDWFSTDAKLCYKHLLKNPKLGECTSAQLIELIDKLYNPYKKDGHALLETHHMQYSEKYEMDKMEKYILETFRFLGKHDQTFSSMPQPTISKALVEGLQPKWFRTWVSKSKPQSVDETVTVIRDRMFNMVTYY